jgi:hypothetical protein
MTGQSKTGGARPLAAFAWKPEGSPDSRFTLRTKTILDAERRLLAALNA